MTDEDVRLAVYRAFAADGRPRRSTSWPPVSASAPPTSGPRCSRLAAARHLVLDGDTVVMAHPFASVPLGFSVMGRRTLWWGGCAWDSFALPHLLPDEPEVLVATRCPGCGRALSWVVGRDAPPEGDEVAHFLVPTAHIWDDVVLTCGHQRLFCGEPCVDAWLDREGEPKGYVMDLATLWRLASHWYDGRLDARLHPARPGDRRRVLPRRSACAARSGASPTSRPA